MKQNETEKRVIGERPLFGEKNLEVNKTIFTNGESPLKECSDIELNGSMFPWKYPLWYSKNIQAKDCTWFEMARNSPCKDAFQGCILEYGKCGGL